MEFIKLKGVSKSYKKKKVLEDVNLDIEEGDILGIIGVSGSGKTTLLSIIAGLLEPSEGRAVYHSKVYQQEMSIHKNIHKIKKQIGFTPQHNSFYPQLTVRENLFHFGKLYEIKKDILLNNINCLIRFMHLEDHQNKLAENLSGGMQKRLDIACSLVHKPKLLILDEPTSDLDLLLQKDILSLLEEVNKQGITIVLASHHLENIELLCNKIAFIHQGKVQTYNSLEEFREPFRRERFTIRVDSGQEKKLLLRRMEDLPITEIVDQGTHLLVYPQDVPKTMFGLLKIIKQENLDLKEMSFRKVPLKDIFEQIVRT